MIRGPGWLSSVDSSFCGLPMATFSLSILTAETERQKKTETEKDKDREKREKLRVSREGMATFEGNFGE